MTNADNLVEVDPTRFRFIIAVCTTSLFFFSKLCIAANTAWIEYWFGVIGGRSLASEAMALHYEFLLMGTFMGGLRATTVLVAQAAQSLSVAKPCSSVRTVTIWEGSVAASASAPLLSLQSRPLPSATTTRATVTLLFRGPARACELSGDHLHPCEGEERIDYISLASLAWVAAGTLVATPLMYHGEWSRYVCLSNGHAVQAEIADEVGRYGRAFAVGVFPTLALYFCDQVCLGMQAAGLPFLYGGVLYSVVATGSAGLLYPSRGVSGLGLGMTIGAWTALTSFCLHSFLDSRLRMTVAGPCALLLRIASGSAERAEFLRVGRSFARLAVPLAVSNCLSLVRGLIVAGSVTIVSEDDSTAYSIAVAYFQTLEIALLGASSAVSSIASFSSGEEPRRVISLSAAGSLCVASFGLALGALPLMFPRAFASLFGGDVYAYGTSTVDQLEASKVRSFTWLCFASFAAATIATVAAAILHGWRVVVAPTIANFMANAIAVGWAVYFADLSSEASPTWIVMASPIANVLAAVLQLILLARFRHNGQSARE